MKNTNHVQTAIKALKRQREKYVIERDKAHKAAKECVENETFFEVEIKRLDAQISSLEGTDKLNVAV